MAIYLCQLCDFKVPADPEGLSDLHQHVVMKHPDPLQLERPFSVLLAVQIDAFGLPESHRSNIIDRVTREMQLCFGGNSHVQQVSPGVVIYPPNPTTWVSPTPVVSEQVQPMGQEAQVPEVQEQAPPTGA